MNNKENSSQYITGIIPFTYFIDQQKATGSTFLRSVGLTKHSCDFELWEHGKRYDQLIFQKAYWREMMLLFDGPKILDLCDPDWLDGHFDIIELGNLVDAITCSSEKLTILVNQYFPKKIVQHVPDRLNFEVFPPPRLLHVGKAKKVVWFGFIKNAHETLSMMVPIIKKFNLQLTIISERPYSNEDEVSDIKPEYIKYEQSTVYEHLKSFDIALNPKSNRAMFKYKSNNKSIIAWKLGIPVAETVTEFEELIDPNARNFQVYSMRSIVEKEYDINSSIREYREIFQKIRSLNK